MHLHIIEPRADGHRMQFVRRLIAQAPVTWRLSLSTFESSLQHTGTAAARAAAGGRLACIPISGEAAFEARVRGGDGFALQPAYWKLFRRHWRQLPADQKGDLVVVPYLDYCSYAIGMLGSPFGAARFAGIVMRPDFHWAAQGVVAPPARHARLKRWLFGRLLRSRTLHRIVTIDPSLRDWAAGRSGAWPAKLRYADDPADLTTLPDKAVARQHFGLRADAFVVLLFGGIDIRKGVADLLAVAAGPHFPEHAQVLIVGRQSDEVRQMIAKGAWASSRLLCVDRYVDEQEEALAFACADCGWLAYRGFHGTSGVLSQCRQAGLQVIWRAEGVIHYVMATAAAQRVAWLPDTSLRLGSAPPVGALSPLSTVFEGWVAHDVHARPLPPIANGSSLKD